MTSISGSMSTASMMSPNDRMKLALQSAVSAGTVKSADQSALSGALDDIDTAMKASGPPSSGSGSDDMKTKIDSLVDKEVSDGKLTDDQAAELKKVFADAAQQMASAQGPGGPPPPPPSDSTDGTESSLLDSVTGTSGTSDTSSTSSTSDTSSASATSDGDPIKALISFLQQLDRSVSSSSVYGSTGASTASASTSSSLLVDTSA